MSSGYGCFTQLPDVESAVEESSTMFVPSVSLMDLTGYIDQLRAFLPKAEKSGLSAGSEGVGVKGVGPMAYVDQALVKAWDRMSTKVSILSHKYFVCKDFHYY